MEPNDKQKEEARRIRLPFPCGCLDAHSGGGMTVREHTCEAHYDIASALSSRDTEIREVLGNLRTTTNCWCLQPRVTEEVHDAACLAAQALWNKVKE